MMQFSIAGVVCYVDYRIVLQQELRTGNESVQVRTTAETVEGCQVVAASVVCRCAQL